VSNIETAQSSRPSVPGANPRIAFGSWAFAFGPFESDPWEFDRLCRYAADAGYDQDFADDESCARLGDEISARGLGISAYAPDFRGTPPAEVQLADYLARIDSVLAFCRRLGIDTVRTDTVSPPGPLPESEWQQRYDRLVAAWQAAADRCADSGVRMVWEFEPGFWLNRPSEVVRLLQTVDRPNFQVLYDTSHARTGAVAGARQGPDPELLPGGAVEYAHLLAPWLGHLHLIDSDGSLHDDETSDHLPFGKGDVPFDQVIDALGPAALQLDWWTVDFCFCPTTEQDARLAVPIVRDLAHRAGERAEVAGA
jgi:sugar phosphate isomerase/epimerase